MEKTLNEVMNENEAAAERYLIRKVKTAREAKINELQEKIEELKIERTSLDMEFSRWKNLSDFYRYNEQAIKNKRNRAEKTIENNLDRIRKDLRAATAAEAEAINELHRMIDNLNKITL